MVWNPFDLPNDTLFCTKKNFTVLHNTTQHTLTQSPLPIMDGAGNLNALWMSKNTFQHKYYGVSFISKSSSHKATALYRMYWPPRKLQLSPENGGKPKYSRADFFGNRSQCNAKCVVKRYIYMTQCTCAVGDKWSKRKERLCDDIPLYNF